MSFPLIPFLSTRDLFKVQFLRCSEGDGGGGWGRKTKPKTEFGRGGHVTRCAEGFPYSRGIDLMSKHHSYLQQTYVIVKLMSGFILSNYY